MIWLCGFIQAIVESRSRQADLYLKHLTWQPMTDDDVEWVNNPQKIPQNP
jgi:hypothetical protein